MEPGESQAEAVRREVQGGAGLEMADPVKAWSTISHDGRWATHWWVARSLGLTFVPTPVR